MAHQRLRYGCIHSIHGHMVTVIGSPAQCHISGSDYHTIILIGNVHQNLGTFPCLSIFISDIMYALILTNIPEMNAYCFFDIYFYQLCAKTANET